MPCSRAATRAKGLNADPAGRPPPPAPVARLTRPKWGSPHQLRPPAIALTAPVPGSSATRAPQGSPARRPATEATDRSAAAWARRSTVVAMRSPPVNTLAVRALRLVPMASKRWSAGSSSWSSIQPTNQGPARPGRRPARPARAARGWRNGL
jgi:hypothetical protein